MFYARKNIYFNRKNINFETYQKLVFVFALKIFYKFKRIPMVSRMNDLVEHRSMSNHLHKPAMLYGI